MDYFFLGRAVSEALRSPDPRTKVGAIIAAASGSGYTRFLSAGFNHFPTGVRETPERLADHEFKNRIIVHAEMDAIACAARLGIDINGATLYIACVDAVSSQIWGGPPCLKCLGPVLQAGIGRIVCHPTKAPTRWAEDLAMTKTLLAEARIPLIELPVLGPRS